MLCASGVEAQLALRMQTHRAVWMIIKSIAVTGISVVISVVLIYRSVIPTDPDVRASYRGAIWNSKD